MKEFKRIKEKYESNPQTSCCEIKLEYESMTMKNNKDPEFFYKNIENLL